MRKLLQRLSQSEELSKNSRKTPTKASKTLTLSDSSGDEANVGTPPFLVKLKSTLSLPGKLPPIKQKPVKKQLMDAPTFDLGIFTPEQSPEPVEESAPNEEDPYDEDVMITGFSTSILPNKSLLAEASTY